jgi:transcription antitermination factor NusG
MAKRWYSVSVLSNFEKRVAEQIRTAVAENGLEDEIEEVLVPEEDVIEIRRGKKVTVPRRFMPGYVLVRMEMTDIGYHAINSIPRVTGFLGPQGRPMPMRDEEVNASSTASRKARPRRGPPSPSRSARRSRSTMVRSRISTAWSKRSTTTTSA